MRGYPFVQSSLFPHIKLEQILEMEFYLAHFFKTSPASFAEYDFKSFIWQYDRMIKHEEQQNKDGNRTEIKNPFLMRD